MKSEQKEIKTKMDDLEANTQKMQVKLTKKWKNNGKFNKASIFWVINQLKKRTFCITFE
jgi:hypothetical protein